MAFGDGRDGGSSRARARATVPIGGGHVAKTYLTSGHRCARRALSDGDLHITMGSDDGSAPRASSTAKRIWTTFTAISLFAIFIVAAQLFWLLVVVRGDGNRSHRSRRHSVRRNHEGVEIHILPTGASIHRLLLPDRKGRKTDVALGMDSEAGYSDGMTRTLGAIAGRFANRNCQCVLHARR